MDLVMDILFFLIEVVVVVTSILGRGFGRGELHNPTGQATSQLPHSGLLYGDRPT